MFRLESCAPARRIALLMALGLLASGCASHEEADRVRLRVDGRAWEGPAVSQEAGEGLRVSVTRDGKPLIDLPFGDESVRVPLAEAALGVLDSMEEILGEDPAIGFQREKILHPEKRYAERIRRICGTNGEDYIAAGLRLAAEAAEGSETNVQEDR